MDDIQVGQIVILKTGERALVVDIQGEDITVMILPLKGDRPWIS